MFDGSFSPNKGNIVSQLRDVLDATRGMKSLMMGIDLGAGGVKVSIIDLEGVTVGIGSSPIETYMPEPGWAEQEPVEWWTAARAAIRDAIINSHIDPAGIAAVGMSGGAHIGVLTDENGEPLRRAILWSRFA